MGKLRDYRITWKPEEGAHHVQLFEGSKVKDNFLTESFDSAKLHVSKWMNGQSNLTPAARTA